MKQGTGYIILTVAAVFTIFLFIKNPRQSAGSDTVLDEKQLYELGKAFNDHLAGTEAPDIICTDASGNSAKLSEIVDRKVLVLYYSEFHCNTCYENQFELLQNSFPDSTKLLVLGSHIAYKLFDIYWNRNGYSLPAYFIAHGSFNWFINYYNHPYFFVLDKDLTVSYFYLTDNSNTDKTTQYLEGVKRLFMDEK